MDLREYYRKLREQEACILEPYVTVVSRKTVDGGRRGIKLVVSRAVAAKMIVDGRAELEDEGCC